MQEEQHDFTWGAVAPHTSPCHLRFSHLHNINIILYWNNEQHKHSFSENTSSPPPTAPFFFFVLRQTLNEVWTGRLNYNKSSTYRLFIYKYWTTTGFPKHWRTAQGCIYAVLIWWKWESIVPRSTFKSKNRFRTHGILPIHNMDSLGTPCRLCSQAGSDLE